MITAAIEYVTAGGVVALAIALSGWLLLHTKNHTSKVDISKEFDRLKGPEGMQWKDVCNERTKRIEAAIMTVDNKVVDGFKDLKELVEKNGRKD